MGKISMLVPSDLVEPRPLFDEWLFGRDITSVGELDKVDVM